MSTYTVKMQSPRGHRVPKLLRELGKLVKSQSHTT